MRKRRILYINNGADLYGASRCLIRLLQALDRTRFVPLVVLPTDGPLRNRIEELGVEVIFHRRLSIIARPVIRSWRVVLFLLEFPFSVLFLWRLIRQRHIDLVHTNTGVIVSPGLAAKLAGVSHLWHIRDWFQEFRTIWKPYSKYITWSSDAVISISSAVASQFPKGPKIKVVYDGFTLDEFKVVDPAAGKNFRIKFNLGDAFVIGCVGRIKLHRKGQEVLVQASALLKAKTEHNFKVVIIGSAFPGNESHVETLKGLVKELGLQKHVILTGELDDVKPAYMAMDVLVLPSAQPEPLGGVMMEAMAMNLPVIASNIGGPIEVVLEGETGFLVPPANPQALAEKLEVLMNDPQLRARMAKAGPQRMIERFSLDEMIGKIEALMSRALTSTQCRDKS
jgi:glycosyltransferase involved in cell wall biosynthesis